MENNNMSVLSMSDKTLLSIIGDFIKANRLKQNKTQQEIATAAGLNRTTLVQMEAGGGGNMLSFIQVMRAIDQLYLFENFEVKEQISPIAMAKLQLGKRRRAGRNHTIKPD